MRTVDRIAEDRFSLSVLQMMENAGRNLALHAMQFGPEAGRIVVLAGPGGNGGGGLSCTRHLHNHGFHVDLLLTHDPDTLRGPAETQYRILKEAGLQNQNPSALPTLLSGAALIIDALLGYSLKGPPQGLFHEFIVASNESSIPILSLDLPSGTDATTGEMPGVAISPVRTLTLALPKRGLRDIPGQLFLGDIGIPPELYQHLGIDLEPVFTENYWVELVVPGPNS